MEGEIEEVLIEFDPNGSLATTHDTQGSDMGLFGGFLGWEADDDRLADSAKAIQEAGIKIKIDIVSYGATHPNTYNLTLKNSKETHEMTAVSTGGGMIEITQIDGIPLSMSGDFFETLIAIDSNEEAVIGYLEENIRADALIPCKGKDKTFIQIKAQSFFSEKIYSELKSRSEVLDIKQFSPVLPVLSRKEIQVPFTNCQEMVKYNEERNLDLWELAAFYESARGNISVEEVFEQMRRIIRLMQTSIKTGLKGTEFKDRILGHQSGVFKTRMESNHLLDGGILNQIILYVTAMMEVKSAMGVIVAAPTAGSCGCLPGACMGAGDVMGLSENDMTKGMLAAGMIGVFISSGATFAAEVGGCQAECGAASGMAAAALVTLAKGNIKQAISASSMALQNILGMVCDPVANRVEVPCLGKNVLAAGNALASANMALADFDPVVPLDEVIETMDKVGKSIPSELRCTARGGLSVTKTSKEVKKRLKEIAKSASGSICFKTSYE